MNLTSIIAAAAVLVLPAAAWGNGGTAHKPSAKKPAQVIEEQVFGRPGDPKKVSRTVNIDMSDVMRFSPASLTVKQGETVRFVAKNSGKVMHEMVLGTLQELKEHAELMKKHPGMEHDEPYMAHVAPGKTERIIWQFNKAGEFYYGCLIPGHFEAGMTGKINVTAR